MLSISKKIVSLILIFLTGVYLMGCRSINTKKSEGKVKRTFANPIIPAPSADPWVVRAGGYYWYIHSSGDMISIRKADRLERIGEVGDANVWLSPSDGSYSKEVWAPELHYLNGRWYIYFAADDGKNENHRMYVLEGGKDPDNPLSGPADPENAANSPYKFKGKISDKTDKWAIDGTVLQKKDGSLYFIWSGWEGDVDGQQNLYIAPMSNPWTISGDRVLISKPEYDWEKKALALNEGPEILKNGEKIFIAYSASGSWTYDYCLGMLVNSDGDVLNPSSWVKIDKPVFEGSVKNKSRGVGHCSFVKSPDGKEDWIVYHGMTGSQGWGARSVRTQKFAWGKDGMPVFGEPVPVDTPFEAPSGEK